LKKEFFEIDRKMKTKRINFFGQFFLTKTSALFFAVVLFLFLTNFSWANAEEKKQMGTCKFTYTDSDGNFQDYNEKKTKTECEEEGGFYGKNPRWIPDGSTEAQLLKGRVKGGSACSGVLAWTSHPLDCSLLAIIGFLASMVAMAATLFTWIVEPAVFKAIVDSSVIYGIWAMVRDSLNIAFILMLLFSAFATVFQVDKYNYKNILVKLVIMALLVNFSFPITRAIIDFSNSLMYYFLSMMSGGVGYSFVDILETGGIGTIIDQSQKQVGATDGTAFLIGVVVFLFIFMITVLAIAILMVIRAITLAILVIFSSVAFVGPVVPPLSQHAGKWWTALFNNSFFGPAMIFMLYVALTMMGSISGALKESESKVTPVTVAGHFSGFSELVAAMAISSLPIVILWIGIGMAKTMGAVGADAVMGRATKWGKQLASWGTIKPAKFIAKATEASTLAGGIGGGVKKRWDSSYFGKEASDKRKGKIEDYVYKKMGGKVDSEQEMKKKAKEYEDKKIGEEDLKTRAKGGDSAAAYLLSKDNKMDAETYQSFIGKNKDEKIEKEINANVRKTRVDLVASNNYKKKYDEINNRRMTAEESANFKDANPNMAGWAEEEIRKQFAKQEAQKEANKLFRSLDRDSWEKQDWVKMNKELSSKTNDEQMIITGAVGDVFDHRNVAAKEKMENDMAADKWASMVKIAQSQLV